MLSHNAFKSKEVYERKEKPYTKCIKSDIKNQDDFKKVFSYYLHYVVFSVSYNAMKKYK